MKSIDSCILRLWSKARPGIREKTQSKYKTWGDQHMSWEHIDSQHRTSQRSAMGHLHVQKICSADIRAWLVKVTRLCFIPMCPATHSTKVCIWTPELRWHHAPLPGVLSADKGFSLFPPWCTHHCHCPVITSPSFVPMHQTVRMSSQACLRIMNFLG